MPNPPLSKSIILPHLFIVLLACGRGATTSEGRVQNFSHILPQPVAAAWACSGCVAISKPNRPGGLRPFPKCAKTPARYRFKASAVALFALKTRERPFFSKGPLPQKCHNAPQPRPAHAQLGQLGQPCRSYRNPATALPCLSMTFPSGRSRHHSPASRPARPV